VTVRCRVFGRRIRCFQDISSFKCQNSGLFQFGGIEILLFLNNTMANIFIGRENFFNSFSIHALDRIEKNDNVYKSLV